MSYFQIAILGLVQGFGEFLPISSSGHLVLMPWLFDFEDPGLAFDVSLHLGTLFAVIVYFWKDLISLVKVFFTGKSDENFVYSRRFVYLLIVATIPGALAGYFLDDYAETFFRSPLLVAGTLTFFGFLLYFADKSFKKRLTIDNLTYQFALIVGLFQAFAIVPGTSRSGITITIALLLGLNKKSSAKFSFLMSIPIILGATLFKFPDLVAYGIGPKEIFGILVSASSGYFAIAFLMKFVSRVGYKAFFWYRLFLATFIIFLYFLR